MRTQGVLKFFIGYVKAHLKVPEISAFDTAVNMHTVYVPITLGMLHIDMVINLATKAELENLNKQWNMGLIERGSTCK